MQKYIKTIGLAVVAAAVLCFYFIGAAEAEKELPQFRLKTLAGSEKELDNLSLRGDLSTEFGGPSYWVTNRDLEITKKGTFYMKETWYGMSRFETDTRLEKLQKKYKSFMRGKETFDPAAFYEDDRHLAYAAIEDGFLAEEGKQHTPDLKISVLDKRSGETKAFETKLPHAGSSAYLSIQDVQMTASQQLKVLVNLDMNYSDNVDQESILYTVDLKKQRVSDEKKLFAYHSKNTENSSMFVETAVNSEPLSKNQYIVQSGLVTEEAENEQGEYISKETRKDYMSFNIENGKSEKIDSIIAKDKMIPQTVEGNILYGTKTVKEGIRVQLYDLEKKKDLAGYTIDWPKIRHPDATSFVVHEGKVYLYNTDIYQDSYYQTGDSRSELIHIAEARSGKTLYQGEIVREDAGDDGYHLSLQEIVFK